MQKMVTPDLAGVRGTLGVCTRHETGTSTRQNGGLDLEADAEDFLGCTTVNRLRGRALIGRRGASISLQRIVERSS